MSDAYVIDETAVARRELANSQYGGHPNAEALIRAHFASIPPEVRSGIRLSENADALAAARDAEAGDTIEVPEGGKLVDWTVRGTDPRRMVLSYVWEDEGGRWHHGVQGYSDAYEQPGDSPADKTLREVAMHDARVQKDSAEANLAVEERLAQFRAELNQEIAKHFQSLNDELSKNLQAIVADARGGGEDDSEPSDDAVNRGGADKTTKKATSAGESGQGDASSAPAPSGGGDSEGDTSEAKWPREHAGIDEIAKKEGVSLPDDWDDLKTADKVAYLEGRGVKPEAAEE